MPTKGSVSAGYFRYNGYIAAMSTKVPNPTQVARAERMRNAAETGAQARADVKAQDIAVRKNMERLRELRLAKEAAEPPVVKAKPRAKKAVAKKAAPGKLSDFIRDQAGSGHKT